MLTYVYTHGPSLDTFTASVLFGLFQFGAMPNKAGLNIHIQTMVKYLEIERLSLLISVCLTFKTLITVFQKSLIVS